MHVSVADGVLSLRRGEQVLLSTNIAGRITQLRWTDRLVSLRLPDTVAAGARLDLPCVDPQGVAAVRVGERDGDWRAAGGGITLTDLGPRDGGTVTVIAVA